MSVFQKIIAAATFLLSTQWAFAQVDGRIGRPGERYPDDPGRHHDRGAITRSIINCSSIDHRFATCPVRGEIVRVNLYRQLSRAQCSQGYTFGYDRQALWVDQGCRAEFEVLTRESFDRGGDRGDDRDHHRRDPGYTQTIDCDSTDYRYTECFTGNYGPIRDAQLIQQRSRSECRYGFSWGFTNDRIWVDRGCRATFRVEGDGYR